MSLSAWQEQRAITLRAKGFPPGEVARAIQASEAEIREKWPKLVLMGVGAAVHPAILQPKTPPAKDRVRPALVWPTQKVGGMMVTPLQRLPPAPAEARAVMQDVATKHGLSLRLMLAPRNLAVLVRARQEAMWRLRSEQNRSWNGIAKLFQVDHSTVIHGFASHVERVKNANRR